MRTNIIKHILHEGLNMPKKTRQHPPITELLSMNGKVNFDLNLMSKRNVTDWKEFYIEYIDSNNFSKSGKMKDLIETYFTYQDQFYYLAPFDTFRVFNVDAYKIIHITNVETGQNISSENPHFKETALEWFDGEFDADGIKFFTEEQWSIKNNLGQPSTIFLMNGDFWQTDLYTFLRVTVDPHEPINEGINLQKKPVHTVNDEEWETNLTGFNDKEKKKIKKLVRGLGSMWNGTVSSYGSGGGFYHVIFQLIDGRVIMIWNGDNNIFVSSIPFKSLDDYYNYDSDNTDLWVEKTGKGFNATLDDSIPKIVQSIRSNDIVDVS